MVQFVDHQTTNRVTDAALVLLDAAREATKATSDYRPDSPNTASTLAIAVQALIIADHMPVEGASSQPHPMPEEFFHRWRGVAAGLGVSIAMVNNPAAQIAALTMCASEMGKQMRHSAKGPKA
ncbi:hypothetical protein O3U67_14110 [Brevundimonas diminuta]|uniref:hypothetical protein n=1 Tax=Brevundimonas diminuta TaxID=293 RepID=UPI0022AF6422|nr:hypothetical protein [Brevundimonas diminuta]MCZ4109226.1 hypothetical protein [Brevundimonas diminuta]